MNWSLTIVLIAIVLLLTVRREPFTEVFGFSGYKKPTGSIRLDDARPDLSGYSQAEADIDNDMMDVICIDNTLYCIFLQGVSVQYGWFDCGSQ